MIGPVTGIVVAGATIYATTRNDNIGVVARATGAATATIYDKAKVADQKYGFADRFLAAGSAALSKAKEIDNEYNISGQTKTAVTQALAQAKEIDTKYEISNKATKAVTGVVTASMNAISSNSNSLPTATTASSNSNNAPIAQAHIV